MFGSMLACGISGHFLGKRSRRIEDEFETARKATNRAAFKSQLSAEQVDEPAH
jgi:hypothetical protein